MSWGSEVSTTVVTECASIPLTTATDASITSVVADLPHSTPTARAADPDSTTSRQC